MSDLIYESVTAKARNMQGILANWFSFEILCVGLQFLKKSLFLLLE